MRYVSCLLVREGDVRPVGADHQRPDEVTASAAAERGLFDVLPYPRDGSPRGHAEQIVAQMRAEWERQGDDEPLVCVVPVRETEAWMLADRQALSDVLSVGRLPDSVPPRVIDVERVHDPKQVIDESVRSVSARRRTVRRHHPQDYYLRLAERIDISVLRKVPAFCRWWDDMTKALEELGYRHG